MRLFATKFIFLAFLLASACSPIDSEISPTVAPSHIPTKTPQPTKTHPPTLTLPPTSIPAPTRIILNDPRITELESLGYTRSDFSLYSVHEDTFHQLTWGNLSYLQYYKSETNSNYVLVFTAWENGQNRVLSIVDISTITHRIYDPVLSPIEDFGCAPMMEWGDVNGNGQPDIVVGCYWAGGHTGSDLHIFEVDNNLKVTNLTGDLPGLVSPDWFDPSNTRLTVIDTAWALHDCLYPLMFVYWVYDWKDGKYMDITSQTDMSSYLDERKNILTAQFGQPFAADRNIRRLTELLIMYDKIGQRERGWQEYLNLADLKNWPGTAERNVAWLRSDAEHFQKQYDLHQPFTPNNYGCSQ